MADDHLPPPAELSDEPVAASPVRPAAWSDVWQIPALAASAGLLGLGLLMIVLSRSPDEFGPRLDAIATLIDRSEYDTALRAVNDLVPQESALTPEERGRLYLLRGDLFYLQQTERGGDAEVNFVQAIEDYETASDLEPLDSERRYRMAEALAALGRTDEARAQLEDLGPDSAELRQRLLKSLIVRYLRNAQARTGTSREEALTGATAMLAELQAEPGLTTEDRIWVTARTAEMHLDTGEYESAIDRLLVTMQKLRAAGVEEFPELNLLLGRAYLMEGQLELAESHLLLPEQQMEASLPQRGDAMAARGRILLRMGRHAEAQELLTRVINEYPLSPAYRQALLDRGEVQVEQRDWAGALQDVEALATEIERSRPGETDEANAEDALDLLLRMHDQLRSIDRNDLALQSLAIGERLYRSAEIVPDELLIRLADLHRDLGNEILGLAEEDRGAVIHAPLPSVDEASAAAAGRHYLTAGAYFRRRAEQLQVEHPQQTAEALYEAAIVFDRGDDHESAIACLQEYIRLSANTPSHIQGTYLLARTYEAAGDLENAITYYRNLIDSEQHRHAPETYASYVPLARCYLKIPKPDPTEALRLLNWVVEGRSGLEPDAAEFRDALIELGRFYAHAEQHVEEGQRLHAYEQGIKRLTEALARYPGTERDHELHMLLGHAYRKAAGEIALLLQAGMSDTERLRYEKVRAESLRESMKHYEQVIARLERLTAEGLDAQQSQALMHAFLWRADAAFALEQFDAAIRMYAEIADRYRGSEVGLVSLIQIVNAYVALGEDEAAQTAQARARRMLAEVPDEAFRDGSLPGSREIWERWLAWDLGLESAVASAGGSDPGEPD